MNNTIDFNFEEYSNSLTIKKIDSKEIKNNTNIKYTQTFEEKNGFIDGLSILDMILIVGQKQDYISGSISRILFALSYLGLYYY